MEISLGSINFDSSYTSVKEKLEELGGRDERTIILSGLIVGESTLDAINERLDAILDAASVDDYGAALSVRSGRVMFVRRGSFVREVSGESMTGSFELCLESKLPFEESILSNTELWIIADTGESISLTSEGNMPTKPFLIFVASGDVVNPSFSDGTSTITYFGIVEDGKALTIDSINGVVRFEGEDVTPYTSGEFPEISSEGTTLTYTDDPSSSHRATVQVSFHDRWW